ncbi:PAS domain S-box protein [Burkholderia sp. FERM BP-3421]|uniref:PAS domain S-box protein n=1 Tax=Burkholderia sp. FERM BP-3421 TaxID=1494466 RepID=UPI0023630099|nr:PAS domain S-box protein [Burkholderia sp. FERM BP-3421]WDD92358.1 PAS domain S-box protein [Burkholderia sp. FERM BP-3421]
MTASGTSSRHGDASTTDAARVSWLHARPASITLVAFALGAAASLGVAGFVEARWQAAAHARFERRATHLTEALRRELSAGAAALDGARGALSLVRAPGQDAWNTYVSTLDLDGNRTPVRALGFAAARPGATAAGGPPSTLPISVTRFAPPTVELPADMGARDAGALWRAADTGQVALAVRDASDGHPAALTLFLPVYRPDSVPVSREVRRAALEGFVFASLNVRRVFEQASADERGIGISASRAGDLTPLFAADAGTDDIAMPGRQWRQTDVLRFGGDTLTLAYTADIRAGTAGAADLWTALVAGGLAGSAVLAAALYQIVRRRATVVVDAPGSLNEARMMGIIRSSMEAIITIDEAQTVVIFNPMAERVFGVSAMEAIGAPLSRFIPERFRGAHAKHVEQFGVTGVSERQMGRQRVLFGQRASGEEFPIEASISQIREGNGKLYTVMLRDITARLRGEDALRQSREEQRELSANLQNVREEEKTRIARELHDDLGQQLTALKMDLSALEHALAHPAPGATPAVPEQLRGMHRLIDSTVASVRRIAADLRPVMLDDLGLVPAIEWLAQDFTNRYGIEVERDIEPGDTAFNSNGATTLFRIVQEALTNVARHADATEVALALTIDEGNCTLRIADNGRGAPDADAAPRRLDKSFGLIGIRERAHMLGGMVTIDTGRDRGFSITVTFPLQSIQQETSPS